MPSHENGFCSPSEKRECRHFSVRGFAGTAHSLKETATIAVAFCL